MGACKGESNQHVSLLVKLLYDNGSMQRMKYVVCVLVCTLLALYGETAISKVPAMAKVPVCVYVSTLLALYSETAIFINGSLQRIKYPVCVFVGTQLELCSETALSMGPCKKVKVYVCV